MTEEERELMIEEIRIAVNYDDYMKSLKAEQLETLHNLTGKPLRVAVERIQEILKLFREGEE